MGSVIRNQVIKYKGGPEPLTLVISDSVVWWNMWSIRLH